MGSPHFAGWSFILFRAFQPPFVQLAGSKRTSLEDDVQ